MDTKLLLDIGLSPSEVEVYLTLLKMGSSKVGALMKELTLHRSRIYEALQRLSEKGLVSSVIRDNVNHYEAADPHRILDYLSEQKEKIVEKEQKLSAIVPQLQEMISPLTPQAEAHVFVGKEGFKTVRKDVLKQSKTLYLIGAVGKEEASLKYFFPGFNKEREKRGIKWKILADFEVKKINLSAKKLVERRYLPKNYSTPAVINIYADRVVNVMWQGDVPLCFMIINQGIADSYRKWFGLLWKYSE